MRWRIRVDPIMGRATHVRRKMAKRQRPKRAQEGGGITEAEGNHGESRALPRRKREGKRERSERTGGGGEIKSQGVEIV